MASLSRFGVDKEVAALRAIQDDMQRRTFTKWWNSYLIHRDIQIESLTTDLGDGIALINLMECISSDRVGKYAKTPKALAHKIENINKALTFIRNKGVDVRTISAEDILEGNETLILGLSWMLILRFEVEKYGADTHELLKWVKAKTAGYDGVDIVNFKQSFNDGLAFSALIDKHFPDLMDYEQCVGRDPTANLENAFAVAEEHFGVPRLLDAADLIGGDPDEKSVIVYVAKLRDAFSDKSKSREEEERLAALERQRQEEEARKRAEEELAAKRREEAAANAANALANLLPAFINRDEHVKETDAMTVDANGRANDLAEWAKGNDDTFSKAVADHDLGATVDETQGKLDALNNNFRGQEKPPRSSELNELDNLYNAIAARRALEGRDAPKFALSRPDLHKAWDGMESAEVEYESQLKSQLTALGGLLPLLDRYRSLAAALTTYTASMADSVADETLAPTRGGLIDQLDTHHGHLSVLDVHTANEAALTALGARLSSVPEFADEIKETGKAVRKAMADVSEWAIVRSAVLEEAVQGAVAAVERAHKVAGFKTALTTALRDGRSVVGNPSASDTASDVIELIEAGRTAAAGLAGEGVAESDCAEIAEWNELVPALETRRDEVKGTKQAAGNSEALHKRYAGYGNAFDEWAVRIERVLTVTEAQGKDALLQRAKVAGEAVPEGETKLATLQTVAREIREAGAVANPPISHYSDRFESLRNRVDTLRGVAEGAPEAPNVASLKQHLDVLGGGSGAVDPAALARPELSDEQVAYLTTNLPRLDNGKHTYTDFNPFPASTGKAAKFTPTHAAGSSGGAGAGPSTTTTTAASPSGKTSVGVGGEDRASDPAVSGALKKLMKAEQAEKERKAAKAAAKAAGKPAATTTPAAGKQTASPAKKTAAPAAAASTPPSTTVAPGEDMEVEGDRTSNPLEEGVIIHTTQSSSSPVTIKYEIEAALFKKVEATIDFAGSENIEILIPSNATGLSATAIVEPYATRTLAVVRQIDVYANTKLAMGYKWKKIDPS